MPNIQESLEKIKPFYYLILILIIASIFFAIGRLSALEDKHTPIKIEYPDKDLENATSTQTASVIQTFSQVTGSADTQVSTNSGDVIGSKSGKKYYYPWCGALKRVKPENQVKFSSIDVARSAGYSPASNCKGLK